MIRVLYPTPGPVDFGLLAAELRAVDPTVIDANDVGGMVAVYTPATPDETALGAVVVAHAGPPAHHPLDPHGQLVTLLVVVGALTLDDAEHVAGPSVTAADLTAEAEAWSLGA